MSAQFWLIQAFNGISYGALLFLVGAGLSLNGAIAALFILAPQAFLTAARTSGVGLVLATGRLGAILSPAIAGVLLDASWSTQDLFGFFAGSQLLAALLVWLGCRRPLSVPA